MHPQPARCTVLCYRDRMLKMYVYPPRWLLGFALPMQLGKVAPQLRGARRVAITMVRVPVAQEHLKQAFVVKCIGFKKLSSYISDSAVCCGHGPDGFKRLRSGDCVHVCSMLLCMHRRRLRSCLYGQMAEQCTWPCCRSDNNGPHEQGCLSAPGGRRI